MNHTRFRRRIMTKSLLDPHPTRILLIGLWSAGGLHYILTPKRSPNRVLSRFLRVSRRDDASICFSSQHHQNPTTQLPSSVVCPPRDRRTHRAYRDRRARRTHEPRKPPKRPNSRARLRPCPALCPSSSLDARTKPTQIRYLKPTEHSTRIFGTHPSPSDYPPLASAARFECRHTSPQPIAQRTAYSRRIINTLW